MLRELVNIEPGTRLGPYEIVAHIGAGGMGTVYRTRTSAAFSTSAQSTPSTTWSPDGKWIGFFSGGLLKWSVDGSALFFLRPDRNLMRAGIDARERLRVTATAILFPVSSAGMMEFESLGLRHYAVAKDRILVRELPGGKDADPVTVLVKVP